MADGKNDDKDFKNTSAEVLTDLFSDARRYLGSRDFKADGERLRRGAGERLKNVRERYRSKKRTPEDAARERELSLRLAGVEAEAAELRLRLAGLMEEEEVIRKALDEL